MAYVQVKDGKKSGTEWQLCPLGQGQVSIGPGLRVLCRNGYEGA